jgi:thymidine kinase
MFAGKSAYIIREYKKWKSIGKHVLTLNYAGDIRYTTEHKIVSHDQESVDCVMIEYLTDELTETVKAYDVILINEAQFFTNLKKYVRYWTDDLKKIVIVSGLDGDYMREKFGEILDLVPCADQYIKLKAYCTLCADGTDALFSWKKTDRINSNNIIDIGVDKYEPLCRKHYNQEKNINS